MPIGKNAIKRVSNNGYSSVKTSAPDMENSVVAEEQNAQAIAEKPAAEKKPTQKKTTKASPKAATPKVETQKVELPKKAPSKKAAPKKSMEVEPTFSPVNTAKVVISKIEENERKGNGYINIGGELPYYLL